MALAKYFEDIEERWLEETAGLYESRLSEVFDAFPARPSQAGVVYLTRGGRRMEDIEVCEVGHTLELGIFSTPGTSIPVVEFDEDSGRRELGITAGTVRVPLLKAGTRHLRISSDGYVKPYEIHVVEPLRLGQLPDFAKLIHSLSDNPPQWTEESFEEFRSKLASILAKAAVPELFSIGLNEFHIALFHEERRLPGFRDRLQTAYGCLRWFIPYSDIARMVCTYFLFCANEFEAAYRLSSAGRSRLERAAEYLLDQMPSEAESGATTKTGLSRLPLLMALPDVLSFQAIEAIDTGRLDDAAELLSVTRRHTLPTFDKERAERLALLEARMAEIKGDLAEARARFEILLHSPWHAIVASATRHLARMPNG
jgi:hypothetical protein